MKSNIFAKAASVLFSRRSLMFLFFLVIAFIAWFVNRLSNEYRVPLELNICLYNSLNEKSPQFCSEGTLSIVAKTHGFYIVQHRLTKPPVVYIDIRNQRVRQSGSQYYMLVSALKNDIAQLLNDDMEIESYGRDTLFFRNSKPNEIPAQGTTVYGSGTSEYSQKNRSR